MPRPVTVIRRHAKRAAAVAVLPLVVLASGCLSQGREYHVRGGVAVLIPVTSNELDLIYDHCGHNTGTLARICTAVDLRAWFTAYPPSDPSNRFFDDDHLNRVFATGFDWGLPNGWAEALQETHADWGKCIGLTTDPGSFWVSAQDC